MTCSQCHKKNPERAHFCAFCGAALSEAGLSECTPAALSLESPQNPFAIFHTEVADSLQDPDKLSSCQAAHCSLLSLQEREEIAQWQKAANYFLLKNTLQGRGAASIFWGLIAIGLGYYSLEINPINGILLGIGVLLFGSGVWLINVPSPAGFILDAMVFFILGLWNIVITILNGGELRFFIIIGILQIKWAFDALHSYGYFASRVTSKPPVEVLDKVEAKVKELQTAQFAQHPEVIEFVLKEKEGELPWKALLEQDKVLLIRQNGAKILFLRPEDLQLTLEATEEPKKLLPITVEIKHPDFTAPQTRGKISAESWQRYEQWKKDVENSVAWVS